ncbi:hypothetical protein TRFO_24906 [Tritrichomonas foetus]|uniref:Uncharacterized protein n=1 Tax=Tritrichomonas foetus TaxID=1144522 RepID=A0A1J4K664_9EUKA|nr:hypothetical protein TRFO_24906 [Tritrichomonas foetus]|eukprot:OHT06945.1 hypothetical protein TRFO_24906 [Tritrichomonas foetus]
MEGEIDRGFEGILLACADAEDIPFECIPQCFSNDDGTYDIFEIKNGTFLKRVSTKLDNTPDPKYEQIVEIDDNTITGDVDESTQGTLNYFNDYIADHVANYFDTIVVRVKLVFGVIDNIFYLLDESKVITNSSPVSSGIFKQTEESKSSRADYSTDANYESEIYNSIDDELNREIDWSQCVSMSNDCGRPTYRIKRTIAALYRMHLMYPDVSDLELYYQIKLRIHHVNEEVPCCVQCYHLFMAVERVCRSEKKPGQLKFELKPRPFQPLVQSELQRLKKKPIDSITQSKNDPYCFVLNLTNSPYRGPMLMKPAPPKPDRGKKRAQTVARGMMRQSLPKWVSRMTGDDFDRFSRYKGQKFAESVWRYRGCNIGDLPYFQTPIGYSEALAPKKYLNAPFDVTILDPKNKRKLHRKYKLDDDDF